MLSSGYPILQGNEEAVGEVGKQKKQLSDFLLAQ